MTFCKIIIKYNKSDGAKLRGFAIDPSAGFIFTTKHDETKRNGAAVLRFASDGSQMQSLVKEKIFFPYHLSLDLAMKRLFFLDHYFDFVQQCDYDGGNRRFLQKLPLLRFHRIASFENRFFASIHNNNSIVQFREGFTSFKQTATEDLASQPKQFKIFHQQVQPKDSKVKLCSPTNKCEHLCVPVAESNSLGSKIVEKCLCREGYKYENGICLLRPAKKFLMYVQDSPKTLTAVDLNNSDEQLSVPIIGLKPNVAFDVDLNNRIVYFSSYSSTNDSSASIIEFRSLNGSSDVRGRLEGSFNPIQSMAFDYVGRNLFLSSQSPKPKISAVRLRDGPGFGSTIVTVVSKNITGPISLALDPEEGK